MSVNVEVCISPYPSKGLLQRLRILRYASRINADLLHIAGDIHFAALGTDPARTVVTVADCGRLHQLKGIKREILRQFWFQHPLKRAAALTVISQAVKDDLLTWVPDLEPSRIHVVPVSISPSFHPSSKTFNREKPRILQIGTKPNKNIPRLVQALRGVNCTLVLIGLLSPDLRQILEEHHVSYENYSGLSESEIVDEFHKADLVVFASTLEGFGMPILESQTVGRAVVTSNCTSMPEVAGDGAALVDPFSVASIRKGVLQVIEDQAYRNRLIELGKLNCRRFTPDAIAIQYLKIYQSIINKNVKP
ncbi:glycosyltransferase [Cyanobium sp. Maggiore-St4-Cus]|uniref:glycosyltransferase n=1 Tax=Cyanobium sp. Maggiore-St4-Cus TaxID=2823717 RepID=UPI0020CD1193|nr:glycosyltransferase [Cyanobium sp. Maggiore-St4-Cus]MCP9787690.1 glycosyltransferase [Cyanobium sp. Maggiore-St4-Cus]